MTGTRAKEEAVFALHRATASVAAPVMLPGSRLTADGLYDVSRPNAAGTDSNAGNIAVLPHMPDLLKVGKPDALGLIVGMADVVPHVRLFPAKLASSAHNDSFLSDPDRCVEGTAAPPARCAYPGKTSPLNEPIFLSQRKHWSKSFEMGSGCLIY